MKLTRNGHIVHGMIPTLSPEHPVNEEEEDHKHRESNSKSDIERHIVVSVSPGCCKMEITTLLRPLWSQSSAVKKEGRKFILKSNQPSHLKISTLTKANSSNYRPKNEKQKKKWPEVCRCLNKTWKIMALRVINWLVGGNSLLPRLTIVPPVDLNPESSLGKSFIAFFAQRCQQNLGKPNSPQWNQCGFSLSFPTPGKFISHPSSAHQSFSISLQLNFREW